MTYKETIDTIEYARAFNARNTPLMRALDMAVEALSELEQLKRERDAAVADLHALKQYDDSCLLCKYVEDDYPHCGEIGCWTWRGIKEGAEDG